MSKHVAIEDFTKRSFGGAGISFGVDITHFVSTLRRFADLVEREAIAINSVKLEGECDPKDFTANTLIIKFVDWKEIPKT